jgi:hypothetical protein
LPISWLLLLLRCSASSKFLFQDLAAMAHVCLLHTIRHNLLNAAHQPKLVSCLL